MEALIVSPFLFCKCGDKMKNLKRRYFLKMIGVVVLAPIVLVKSKSFNKKFGTTSMRLNGVLSEEDWKQIEKCMLEKVRLNYNEAVEIELEFAKGFYAGRALKITPRPVALKQAEIVLLRNRVI